MTGNISIIIAVAAMIGLAIRLNMRKKKKGSSCCGDCCSCGKACENEENGNR